MDVGCIHAVLRLDYRLSLWAPTSASRTISAVAEILVRYAAMFAHVISGCWKAECSSAACWLLLLGRPT